MVKIIILAITSFIGTNIDDLIIDIFFFVSGKGKKDICNIVLGKYLGIGVLVIFSIIGALGLGYLPTEYISFLGLIPIGLGIKELISNMQNKDEYEEEITEQKSSNMLWNVALITIANGADNIGVYVTLFTSFSVNEYVIFLSIFMLMIALWCMVGYAASKVLFLKNIMLKYKAIIVPMVYILLGVYILFNHVM